MVASPLNFCSKIHVTGVVIRGSHPPRVPTIMSEMGVSVPEVDQDPKEVDLLRAT